MNGNYVGFSLDQGETWSHIIQITSGILSSQYMSVREVEPNVLYVVYDIGRFRLPGRAIMGCRVNVELI